MATTKKANTSEESPSEKNTCFTIMPFGGWFDTYYDKIYCPAIHEAGLIPKRADDLYRPSTIVNDIWSYTRECSLLLADLTGKNPNVLYELGLAHAIAKPVIIVTESLDDIPFDLRALRVIEYDKNAFNWGEVLRGKIVKAIKEVLETPLKAVLPAFLEVDVSRRKITQSDKEIIELTQEVDAMRRELRGLRSKSAVQDTIDPDAAEAILEETIRTNRHITSESLVSKMARYGVPSGWTIKTAKEIRERIQNEMPF